MSTTNQGSIQASLFKKKSAPQEAPQNDIQTPQSPNYATTLDLKKLQRTQKGFIRQFKAFVMGISGGDCAGKKQLINFMFDKEEIKSENEQNTEQWCWKMPQTGESVAVLHQHYFIKDTSNKFSAEGTDWNIFKRKALSLSLGNPITIKVKQGEVMKRVKIPPAKVICIEGSHIFSQQSQVNDIMNIRVFIDSDSDVRLSRRIYKDTVENGMLLDLSICSYLTKIKPSYQKEIEPTKVNCDLVVPHIGNGYADHKMKDRMRADIGIKNITNLLLTQVRSAIKIYQDMEDLEKQREGKMNNIQSSSNKQNQEQKP